jgi:hypothetical protein
MKKTKFSLKKELSLKIYKSLFSLFDCQKDYAIEILVFSKFYIKRNKFNSIVLSGDKKFGFSSFCYSFAYNEKKQFLDFMVKEFHLLELQVILRTVKKYVW